jgi:hypothetical protein
VWQLPNFFRVLEGLCMTYHAYQVYRFRLGAPNSLPEAAVPALEGMKPGARWVVGFRAFCCTRQAAIFSSLICGILQSHKMICLAAISDAKTICTRKDRKTIFNHSKQKPSWNPSRAIVGLATDRSNPVHHERPKRCLRGPKCSCTASQCVSG